ncbi:Metallo-dependent phosphatase-like protein [Podospora didyma]|uniref:Metallo-dependent phosphatase-like protein n=1 Tax=Podospora didyma TaxID=330526 RepID=A0AAE0JYQ6_9PEZI|nr:Metallo-dependent phosphatase-like protein [Podospora didyma]
MNMHTCSSAAFFQLRRLFLFVHVPRPVVTDLTTELCLYTSQQSAWLYVARANEEELAAEDLLVPPPNPSSGHSWESRLGGIWVLRSKFSGMIDQAVTEVDVLFGMDAPKVPVARLSVLHGRAKPRPNARAALRVREDSKFKIVQISNTHIVTGVGVCKDTIDVHRKYLPESEADPLTVNFIGRILDVEKPDLVILTGDQLHHDILDSKSTLFKVAAPIIERSIPFAAVFGNHDSEGIRALSHSYAFSNKLGTAQMSILQNLPFSLCESGPEHVDGIGNFYLQVLAPALSQLPFSTLYFLDWHGQKPSKIHNPDYVPIKQSQIDWFTETSQAQRSAREKVDNGNRFHLSLAFLHIPLPELGDRHLSIRNGHRREPTESPSFNSHFYDALVKEGISALGCGHDHVNDFCALLPQQTQQDGDKTPQPSLWLCYGGGSGFGEYCSYDGMRFHRRARVWELDTSTGSLKTWKRVEYAMDRVDELVLVESGAVVNPREDDEDRSYVGS